MAGTGLQPTLIALLYLFPGLSGLVLIVRFWRKRIDRTLGLDDALILASWVLAVANCVITHVYSKITYAGYHDEDVPFPLIDWNEASKWQYAMSVVYNPVICFVKASFMYSLQRLRSRNIGIQRSLWGMQAFNLAFGIATTVACVIPCVPLRKKFDPTVPGSCYNPVHEVIANVTITIVTDALVLVIPTWMIYDLHMARKKKMITIAFLSLGGVVIVIGVLRLIWLTKALEGRAASYSIETAYSAIESNVAIIGASGPTMKYIFGFLIPGLRGSMQQQNKKSYSGGNNYGNASKHGTSRNFEGTGGSAIRMTGVGGRRGGGGGYGDLDSASVETETEMEHRFVVAKSERDAVWQWNASQEKREEDADARSDEQTFAGLGDIGGEGITKTVDWTISSNGDAMSGRKVAAPASAL